MPLHATGTRFRATQGMSAKATGSVPGEPTGGDNKEPIKRANKKALLEAVGCILGQNLGSRMKILVMNMSGISPPQLVLPKGKVRTSGIAEKFTRPDATRQNRA